jgi:hypothetical protein
MLENQCTSGKFLVSIVGMATEAQSALPTVLSLCAGVAGLFTSARFWH